MLNGGLEFMSARGVLAPKNLAIFQITNNSRTVRGNLAVDMFWNAIEISDSEMRFITI